MSFPEYPTASRLLWSMACLCLLASWVAAAEPKSTIKAGMPVILVLGDSLSSGHGIDAEQGWVALLEVRLGERGHVFQVVNASTGGDTTRGGLARLESALTRHRPDWVLLELGGNDGLRGISIAETRHNLEVMLKQIQDRGSRVVLLGIRLPPNLGAFYTAPFEAIYPRLAEQFRVPLVPFLLEGVAGDPERMQSDGLHPTAAAQPRVLDNVWRVLGPLLEEPPLAAENMGAGNNGRRGTP